MEVRDLTKIAEKFATVTPARSSDYEAGVKSPKKSWSTATTAAESSYESGVQKSISQKSFSKGVKKAGDSKWQKGATEKGVTRWSAGVAIAQDAYSTGFAPYHSVLSSTTLPARYAKRDPRNLERVRVVATALGQAKEKQT